jgi:hypothetical protein
MSVMTYTRTDLAQIRTVGDLAHLLHYTGFPIAAVVGYHNDSGLHLGSCPANDRNRHNGHYITGPDLSGHQPAVFAPCCTDLPCDALVRSLQSAEDHLRIISPDNTAAAATAFNATIGIAAHTTPRTSHNTQQLILAADLVSSHCTALGQHYPRLARIIGDDIDTELAATGNQHPTTVLYTTDNTSSLSWLNVRTRLLSARSRLILPGRVRLLVLGDDATADITRHVNWLDLHTMLHTPTPTDVIWDAAHTLHTLCNDTDLIPHCAPNTTLLNDLAATVAALHPHVHPGPRGPDEQPEQPGVQTSTTAAAAFGRSTTTP